MLHAKEYSILQLSWIQTTWTTLLSPVHSNNYSYCHQHFFSVTEISIPWLILETCCTSRSLACLIISSNCCAWNVWSSFSLFKSARNIFISPRNVDALTCNDRLSFTRPENAIYNAFPRKQTIKQWLIASRKEKWWKMGSIIHIIVLPSTLHPVACGLRVKNRNLVLLKGHHTWRQTNLHI